MNTAYYALRFLVKDILWSIIFFIPWWYITGRRNLEKMLFGQLEDFMRVLHVRTLARFLFTPMYGLYDPASRVISFFVRIVYFAILMVLMLMYSMILLSFYALWLLFPLFVVYNILFHAQLISFNLYDHTVL